MSLRTRRPPPTSSAPPPSANSEAALAPPVFGNSALGGGGGAGAGAAFGGGGGGGAGAGAGVGAGAGAAFGGGGGGGGGGLQGALASTPPALASMIPSLQLASAFAPEGPPAVAVFALASATTWGLLCARAGAADASAKASAAANNINFLNS